MALETFYRQAVLSVADARPVASLLKRHGWRMGVGRFVAGETLEEALPKLRDLEARGLNHILDLLGEFVATVGAANAMTDEIVRSMDVLAQHAGEKQMSVKPTQLGLGVDEALALGHACRVAEHARALGIHLCLDMENTPYLEPTLRLFETLRAEGHHHVSTVLQSYLYRSLDDLARLLALEPKPAIRIVKGAYRESPEVAYQRKAEVDANFREMVYRGLEAGARINVATHDEAIVREIEAYVRGARLGQERYEFQLLYGVKPGLQQRLAERGHTVRIYVPFGRDWYGYFSRRLAERPANLLFVLRGLFG
jgi:proline dehydrogenase